MRYMMMFLSVFVMLISHDLSASAKTDSIVAFLDGAHAKFVWGQRHPGMPSAAPSPRQPEFSGPDHPCSSIPAQTDFRPFASVMLAEGSFGLGAGGGLVRSTHMTSLRVHIWCRSGRANATK